MKFSENWIREWINPNINIEKLSEKITMSGFQVNKITKLSKYYKNVIIGNIVKFNIYILNKKYKTIQIDIGKKKKINVICNLKFCKINKKVLIAPIKEWPNIYTKIKKNIINKKISKNIIINFSDLKIFKKKKDIIELPKNAPIGINIKDYFNLDDNIITFNIPHNRADCLSLLGITRDIAVFNNIKIKKKKIKSVVPLINDTLNINIKNTLDCPRYISRIIKNININATTPIWIKERLRRSEIKLVNSIIDINNYVMLELGQPIQTFDYNCINGNITIRNSKKNDFIYLKKNKKTNLLKNTLIIADEKKILSIAGIISNIKVNINKLTQNIILESAYFNPKKIREFSSKYNITNNSIYRYEKGVDPNIQKISIERATDLLIKICGGDPGPIFDINNISKNKKLILYKKKINKLIGYNINKNIVINILNKLGFKIKNIKNGWEIIKPSWRFDILFEEDIIEEIIRIYGYNKIPNNTKKINLEYHSNKKKTVLNELKSILINRGYNEIITYSFVNPILQKILYPDISPILIKNPISKNMSAMRLSLLIGLINTVIYNQNRQQKRIRLFESGFRFINNKKYNLGIKQEFILSGIITGTLFEQHWNLPNYKIDYFDVKGDIEELLKVLVNLDNIQFKYNNNNFLHPGKSSSIYLNNQNIGYIGIIHPEIEHKFDLKEPTIVFELLLEKIKKKKQIKINNISKFPENKRDISIIVKENILVSDIINECKKIIKNKLIKINLFDIFRGPKIKSGFKSISISLTLQDKKSSLKETEIKFIINNCIKIINNKFNVYLRN